MQKARLLMLAPLFGASFFLYECVGDTPSGDPDSKSDASSDGTVSSDGTTSNTDSATSNPDGPNNPITYLQDAVEVSAGIGHTCALRESGQVLCWGDNGKGQLGVPTSTLSGSSYPVVVPLGDTAIRVAAGGRHSCAVTSKGTVKCWGDNTEAQTGVAPGSGTGVSPDVKIADGGVLGNVAKVNAGGRHTCAIRAPQDGGVPDFGDILCWGSNEFSQLGTTTPYGVGARSTAAIVPQAPGFEDQPLTALSVAKSFSGGRDFSCGVVFFQYPGSGVGGSGVGCWGANGVGQIGNDGGAPSFARPQIAIQPTGSGVVPAQIVAAGAEHACVRAFDNTSYAFLCWGNNSKGQIVDAAPAGGKNKRTAFVTGLKAADVSAIAAGGETTCVIEGQTVKCAGANDVGQLGTGDIDANSHAAWIAVAGLPPRASAIAVGQSHVCAVMGGGSGAKGPVSCWGNNAAGQLGDGLDLSAGYAGASAAQKYLRATPVSVVTPR